MIARIVKINYNGKVHDVPVYCGTGTLRRFARKHGLDLAEIFPDETAAPGKQMTPDQAYDLFVECIKAGYRRNFSESPFHDDEYEYMIDDDPAAMEKVSAAMIDCMNEISEKYEKSAEEEKKATAAAPPDSATSLSSLIEPEYQPTNYSRSTTAKE